MATLKTNIPCLVNGLDRGRRLLLDRKNNFLKQLCTRCSNIKKKIKLTVNTGQVIFNGEVYYY